MSVMSTNFNGICVRRFYYGSSSLLVVNKGVHAKFEEFARRSQSGLLGGKRYIFVYF